MTDSGSQAQFAKKYGYSRAAVTQFKQAGRLVFISDGVLDFAASRQRILDTSDISRNERTEAHKRERERKAGDNDGKIETASTGNAFHNAKTVREKYLALQAKLDYEVDLGLFVEKDDVDKIIFERARQFRDGLMTWKRRIAPELVGLYNIQEIESLLERDIRFLLNEFSKMPAVE